METSRRLSNQTFFFALAFGLALFLRLLLLGDLPLSDREGAAALQAWQVAQGLDPVLGGQAGYSALTAGLFYLFGGSEFLARIVPALAGSLLVLVPWILRERFPGRAALYLAFILALDPGLLAVSRTASGTIMAVSFTMLAFACWYTRHPYWAGGFAGLALLSGQALIPGLAGLGLAVLMNGGRFWNETETPEGDIRQGALRPGLVAAGVFFLGGSLLLLIPRGPSAALADIAGYFTGWASFSQVPVIRLLGATVIYQPFAIIFGLVGLVYGVSARSRFAMGLGFWLLTALTLALIYPSRQVADLVWALIPLSALAALGLDRALDFSRENLWESLGLMFLTVTLLGFAYLNFNSLAMASAPPQDSLLRWGFFIGTIIMLGVVVALVALGWSAAIARRGALWGIVIALGVYTVSAAMGAAGIREGSANELWRDPPAVIDADLLAQSLDQLSVTNRGTVEALPITIYGVPSASLLWLVREWDARYLAAAPTTTDSPLIIGPLQANPAFGASYRGQDFIWRVAPFWERATWNERLRWLASRQIPRDEEKIILWARTDLFPGGQPAAP